MSQQSIDFYLRQRKDTVKRKAGADDFYTASSKVRVLEYEDGAPGISFVECDLSTPNGCNTTHKSAKLMSTKKETLLAEKLAEGKIIKAKGKAVLKLTFDGSAAASVSARRGSRESSPKIESAPVKNVKFIKKGALSPKKKTQNRNGDITSYLMKQSDLQQDAPAPETSRPPNQQEKLNIDRKELSLGDIKKCVSRSSRINELRNSISRLNKGFDKLKELNAVTNTSSDVSSLKGFKSIELLIPAR